MKAVILLLICSFLTISGQVFWKLAFQNQEIIFSLAFVKKILVDCHFIAGTLLYAAATVLWVYVLSKFDLSYASPMMGITYVFASIAGVVIFHEIMSFWRILGVVFVVIGVIFMQR